MSAQLVKNIDFYYFEREMTSAQPHEKEPLKQ